MKSIKCIKPLQPILSISSKCVSNLRYTKVQILSDTDIPSHIGYGKIEWIKDKKYHRLLDQPAIIRYNSETREIYCQEWFVEGKRHRDNNKPAYISSGIMKWYKNGLLHTDDDSPAIIDESYENSPIYAWYKKGHLNRNNDKPAIIRKDDYGYNNIEYWYTDDILHRENDKPAIIYTNPKGIIVKEEWYVKGKRHRLNGPAIICQDDEAGDHGLKIEPHRTYEWFINDRYLRICPNGNILPASITKNKNNEVVIEKYYDVKYGEPIETIFYFNGKISSISRHCAMSSEIYYL
jgi:hypothetical protein